MRVISGTAKGRKLSMVNNKKTRPTADRVKESLFNILGPGIEGAKVLDIFAGVGSVGIEALSRGADSVVFIDSDIRCVRTISQNLRSLAFANAKVIADDFRKALNNLSSKFNLIFADPPYKEGLLPEVARLVYDNRLLLPHGLFVVEHDTFSELSFPEWNVCRTKKYGQTVLTFLGWKEDDK